MIWDLLSGKQKEEVKEYVKSFGLEIAEIYVQVEENTKEPKSCPDYKNKNYEISRTK